MEGTTVAVDLAMSVFEVAVANGRGQIVERKQYGRASFRRFLETRSASRVVMEACGTAHYWGRLARQHGHEVTLLPPNYVRPFVRPNKTDQADTEALVDAARAERIPAVPVKRAEQQALIALHRIREHWMTTRTARINALRGLLREHGLNLPCGAQTAVLAVPVPLDSSTELPAALRRVLASVREEIRALEDRVAEVDRELGNLAAAGPVCQQLQTIPGIGQLAATALVGTVGHIHAFRRGREFASWLGLTPREYSSGGRRRRGHISKRGDRYLRLLLTHGGRAVVLAASRRQRAGRPVSSFPPACDGSESSARRATATGAASSRASAAAARVPSMTDSLEVQVLYPARWRRRISEAQGRRREAGSEGSAEQSCDPMNKNRIRGLPGRTSEREVAKSSAIKGRGGKSGGDAAKAVGLTSGGLRRVRESRTERVRKARDRGAEVSRGHSSRLAGEGPNDGQGQ